MSDFKGDFRPWSDFNGDLISVALVLGDFSWGLVVVGVDSFREVEIDKGRDSSLLELTSTTWEGFFTKSILFRKKEALGILHGQKPIKDGRCWLNYEEVVRGRFVFYGLLFTSQRLPVKFSDIWPTAIPWRCYKRTQKFPRKARHCCIKPMIFITT